jgi:hypothetical protein
MVDIYIIIKNLTVIQDVNNVILNLYYNTFPRPNHCYVFNQNQSHCIYGDLLIVKKLKKSYSGRFNEEYEEKYFYNGHKPILITNYTLNFQLFHVINNQIPLKYWSKVYNGVHFNYSVVLDQCINNVAYGLLNVKNYKTYHFKDCYGIYTTFIKHNKKYRIIFNFSKGHSDSYYKYSYKTSKLNKKVNQLMNEFKDKFTCHLYSFYLPPLLFDDEFTLILNNK